MKTQIPKFLKRIVGPKMFYQFFHVSKRNQGLPTMITP